MSAFDLIVGIPLMVLFFCGWPTLAFYSLRSRMSLSWGLCLGVAIFVGVVFAVFELRFTASLPTHTLVPMTKDQQTIELIAFVVAVLPYPILSLLFASRFWRRRVR
jgi:hypothetical protein